MYRDSRALIGRGFRHINKVIIAEALNFRNDCVVFRQFYRGNDK